MHVVHVDKADGVLVVTMESAPTLMGCPTCGVVAESRGRRTTTLVDIPCFGRPTLLRWRKRTWRCLEPACPTRVFTEQDEQVARPRGLLTMRACRWVIEQVRREHASIHGVGASVGGGVEDGVGFDPTHPDPCRRR